MHEKLLKYKATVERSAVGVVDATKVEIEGVISADVELTTVRDHFIQKANASGEWSPMSGICFDYRVHLITYAEL